MVVAAPKAQVGVKVADLAWQRPEEKVQEKAKTHGEREGVP